MIISALYLLEQGSLVRKVDERVVVELDGKVIQDIPLIKIDQIIVYGRVTLTHAATAMFLENGIEVTYLNQYGKFIGRLQGAYSKNCILRKDQYKMSLNDQAATYLAGCFVSGKLRNMLNILQRARREGAEINNNSILTIKNSIKALNNAKNVDMVRGIEGAGSAAYFACFSALLKKSFQFKTRVKRPPTDPVNSMLSLAYTMLSKDITSAVNTVGMDPYTGFLHRDRYGRVSLALDLMEEFRPIVADTTVLACINKGIIQPDDFKVEFGNVYYLKEHAYKKFLTQYENKKATEIKHPIFNYHANYRRCMDLQARLLAKYISGELDKYVPLVLK